MSMSMSMSKANECPMSPLSLPGSSESESSLATTSESSPSSLEGVSSSSHGAHIRPRKRGGTTGESEVTEKKAFCCRLSPSRPWRKGNRT